MIHPQDAAGFRLLGLAPVSGGHSDAATRQAEQPRFIMSPPMSLAEQVARCPAFFFGGTLSAAMARATRTKERPQAAAVARRALANARLALTMASEQRCRDMGASRELSESRERGQYRRRDGGADFRRSRRSADRQQAPGRRLEERRCGRRWPKPGLTLAWVPEEHGGAGAELADGFAMLGVAGRYAAPVPLAETLLAGWLLSRAGIACAAGRDVGRAGAAGRHASR